MDDPSIQAAIILGAFAMGLLFLGGMAISMGLDPNYGDPPELRDKQLRLRMHLYRAMFIMVCIMLAPVIVVLYRVVFLD